METTPLQTTTDTTFGEVPPGMHAMAVMGQSGDTKILWDKNKPVEVESAREQFDKLVKKNKYAAFYVTGKDGTQGEQMREFDLNAERIVFVPPMQGG
jgi:hypothetical protein